MDQAAVLAVIQLIPGLIWACLGVFIVAKLYHPFKEDVLPRLTGVQLFGVKLDIRADEVQKAVESVPLPEASYRPDVGATLVTRADRAAGILRGATIAWVDDNPANNLVERRLLSRLGIFVEPVARPGDVAALRSQDPAFWDLVISDAARPGDPDDGADATFSRLRGDGHTGPVIFYVGRVDPKRGTPAGAFGLTNRPDELLHLVIDALERSRGSLGIR